MSLQVPPDAQVPPGAVQRVQAALASLGCPGETVPVAAVRDRIDSARAHDDTTGALPTESLTTTHLFRAGTRNWLVLVRAGRIVDPVSLGGVLGEMDVAALSPQIAAHHTGQHPGGFAPVAAEHPHGVILDVDLARFAILWVPAGHPDWAFPTNYAQLLRITAGMAAEVGELPHRQQPPTMQP